LVIAVGPLLLWPKPAVAQKKTTPAGASVVGVHIPLMNYTISRPKRDGKDDDYGSSKSTSKKMDAIYPRHCQLLVD
jgi:hypothetical protein